MPAQPIDIDSSALFFSLFFYREQTKKYFHSSKWGLIPKYPLHSMTKVVMCYAVAQSCNDAAAPEGIDGWDP
jgi:hypothetical protein